MTRTYRLGKRQEGVDATRQRILSEAIAVISEQGLLNAHIQTVAKRAGVTRPTVYEHFGTKENLWVEAFDHVPYLLSKKLINQAQHESDPVLATKAWFKAWTELWAKQASLIRPLKGFAVFNKEAAHIDRVAIEDSRHTQAKRLVDRLAMTLRLKNSLTLDMAVVQLSLLCSFSFFDELLRQQKSRSKALATLLRLFEETMLEAR